MSIVVHLIKLGKKGKRVLKKLMQGRVPVYMSYVRRIENIKTSERICAMTFDDGPFNLPPSPANTDKCLTLALLEILEKHNAIGTFDIIGDTSNNYPDEKGEEGTAAWGGIKYDHYPDIHKDSLGGAVHCPELVQRIIDGGHELTNHGYRHILFGRKNFVYGKRATFQNISEVIEDLNILHSFVKDKFGYEMKLSRPPHYVDNIQGGHTSYDAYNEMNYQYMAASYDGAGWLPCVTYEEEVSAMHTKMEVLLKQNPDALCGHVIFQKDGYNMARRTPVADGLEIQLALLDKYNYKVVSVSDLMKYSAFQDVGKEHPSFVNAMKLLEKGYSVAYKDNTLKLDNPLKRGELAYILHGKEGTSRRIKLLQEAPKGRVCKNVKNVHPYSGAVQCAMEDNKFQQNQNQFLSEEILTVKEFNSIGARYFEHFVPITLNKGDSQQVTHAMAIDSLAASL